ncbi:hypothetical protein HN873_015325, partial [Arachis hypogaea]
IKNKFKLLFQQWRYITILDVILQVKVIMDVELEEEDEDGDKGAAENGVEKVGDEFLGTMEIV